MRYCLLALALASSSALAQIYQYTDSHGNKVYTNQPPTGVASQPVEIKNPNTIEAVTPEYFEPNTPTSTGPIYQHLALELPDDEALRANNGSFSVRVHIAPELDTSHRLQLLVDGMPHGPAIYAQVLEAINLPRGEHLIAVQVLNQRKVIQQSQGQTVTIQRVHTQSPALRPTPRPRATP